MPATIAWIAIAPVKGMRLQEVDETELGLGGLEGDREFFMVDENNAMISATRLGPLLGIVPEYRPDPSGARLTFTFPDGSSVGGRVELGGEEEVTFFGEPLRVKPVLGDSSKAISSHCEKEIRLMARPAERPGVDRGTYGPATMLGVASLKRLEMAAAEGGEPGTIDRRRFRMNFGIDGIEPHQEDLWLDQAVSLGEAEVTVKERVGRCAATTRDPEIGGVDLKTLHHIRSYRGETDSPEPLPFGVYATVERAGRVRVGDPVVPATVQGR